MKCDASLQRSIDRLLSSSEEGRAELRRLRDEGEAELLSSVVEEYGLEEYGSELPSTVFSVAELREEDFVCSLMAQVDSQSA